MKRYVLIGSGNVAFSIAEALLSNGYIIEAILARNENEGARLAQISNAAFYSSFAQLSNLKFDCCILAISDSAILEIANQLPKIDQLVLQTSGTTSLDAIIKFPNRGVFYPLQSFSKNVKVNWRDVPILVESSNEECLVKLMELASSLSDNVRQVNGQERAYLHLSAVIAANFSNSLLALSQEIISKNTSLDFSILKPLMTVSLEKAFALGPIAAQTGPAKRKDYSTLDKHKKLLGFSSKEAELYEQLSQLIQQQQHDYLQGEA
ncbi:MAG: DUF2520 domain-containing protein [Pseudomonadota bacterium]